jgi:hypothetical protein
MPICIPTMSIAASGSLTGTGFFQETIFTPTSDGFYLFAGSDNGSGSQFIVNGSPINFASSTQGSHLPAQYAYITAGNVVQFEVSFSGTWTAQYIIYSM